MFNCVNLSSVVNCPLAGDRASGLVVFACNLTVLLSKFKNSLFIDTLLYANKHLPPKSISRCYWSSSNTRITYSFFSQQIESLGRCIKPNVHMSSPAVHVNGRKSLNVIKSILKIICRILYRHSMLLELVQYTHNIFIYLHDQDRTESVTQKQMTHSKSYVYDTR